jgi:hypothetical protein
LCLHLTDSADKALESAGLDKIVGVLDLQPTSTDTNLTVLETTSTALAMDITDVDQHLLRFRLELIATSQARTVTHRSIL